ncbi:SixA phosphatase family protein [Oceaniglobus ichthyenteri]|uniref:SixA phosphatase family protein n=1 Tax=Oceaniglobus ichthyenteri TaxID=2136177 RepID=UPI000D3C6513|nr:histidine phosphatase family protein [Oceaniglobus ichthyenteri]
MTLRLILTRHAKSDWDDPRLDDHDRPLNTRGHDAAAAMGAWLAQQGHRPQQALISTAKRAVETWNGMRPALPDCAAHFHQNLYHAAPDTVLAILAKATAQCVLVICHNPGCAMLAEGLVRKAPPHPQFRSYPTAATTVIDWDVDDWALVLPGQGRVVDFVVPRDLIGA